LAKVGTIALEWFRKEYHVMTCLCCAKKMPITTRMVCPLCGHPFKGHGWDGVEAHWKAHHETQIPYSAFWTGLCADHQGARGERAASPSGVPKPSNLDNAPYTQVLAERSSHVENILTHALIAGIAQDLWHRDPWLDVQVFKAEVDDSGFDLVLGCNGSMRYIQIKQTHLKGKTAKYSLRQDFSQMPGGCAVVLVYDAVTLGTDHCLFFGGHPDTTMPDIGDNPVSQSPGRRTAEGVRAIRENYRDVARKHFQGPLTIPQLVDLLFPGLNPQEH
jgi:hypothetical protein